MNIFNYYDGNKAGWKLNADGQVELRENNPVWVDADGNERTVGVSTISNLMGEAKQHRERAEAAETRLATFEGLDAAAARKALDITSKLDQKQLVDAGKVDEVRAEIEGRYKEQLTTAQAAAAQAAKRADDLLLQGAFASSEFIKNRVAIPADLIATAFRDNFKIEGERIVSYGPDGKQIYSDQRIGEPATFDEAIAALIGSRADKDKLLLAESRNGSGNDGKGGGQGGTKSYTRAEFSKMTPADQAVTAGLIREGKANLTD